MKLFKYTALSLILGATLIYSQTLAMGNHVFFNKDGDLNVLVEAGVAARSLDSPYVLFVLYMGMDANKHGSIDRESLTLIYKEQGIKMPELKEFRKNYKNERRDMRVYQKLGDEQKIMTGMNLDQYDAQFDFFPLRSELSRSTERGSLSATIGLRTKVYFKNPGFEKGDNFIIQVKDRKNPQVVTNIVVEL